MTKEEIRQREIILGIVGSKYSLGGMEKFGGLSVSRLERLLSQSFLTARDHETYPRFLRFMKKYNQFRAFGYAVSPERLDSRVVIEGIESISFNLSKEIIEEFKKEFADANELDMESNRCACKYNYEK